MGENLRILTNYSYGSSCPLRPAKRSERLRVQKVAKHFPQRKILSWPLRNSDELKFSMKSLTFFVLRVYILLKNCPERQKIARGCYNRKKLLQTPKVAKHNPNRPICTYITGMCLHGTQVVLLQIVVVSPGTHLFFLSQSRTNESQFKRQRVLTWKSNENAWAFM